MWSPITGALVNAYQRKQSTSSARCYGILDMKKVLEASQ
jgi:hypothetical protein